MVIVVVLQFRSRVTRRLVGEATCVIELHHKVVLEYNLITCETYIYKLTVAVSITHLIQGTLVDSNNRTWLTGEV